MGLSRVGEEVGVNISKNLTNTEDNRDHYVGSMEEKPKQAMKHSGQNGKKLKLILFNIFLKISSRSKIDKSHRAAILLLTSIFVAEQYIFYKVHFNKIIIE